MPPSEPFRLRGLAIALDSSHVSETQDGFYPSGLFAGIGSILGSKEGRIAMAAAPHRNVEWKEKAISAAGAAIISAVIVNPLDVAKVGLKFALESFCIYSLELFFRSRKYTRNKRILFFNCILVSHALANFWKPTIMIYSRNGVVGSRHFSFIL